MASLFGKITYPEMKRWVVNVHEPKNIEIVDGWIDKSTVMTDEEKRELHAILRTKKEAAK